MALRDLERKKKQKLNQYRNKSKYTSESEIPPIALNFCIPMYFDLVITNITMKTGANHIFKVKTQKKTLFFTFFILPQ